MSEAIFSNLDKLEDETVDVLVQRLEAMEKYNEQYKRENQLFESFLLRKQKDSLLTDDEIRAKENKMMEKYGA
jgi:hypothetical protein